MCKILWSGRPWHSVLSHDSVKEKIMNNLNIRKFVCENDTELDTIEKEFRSSSDYEILPWCVNGTPFSEIADMIVPDKDGKWNTPVYFYISSHKTATGVRNLCYKAHSFLESYVRNGDIDILSIGSCLGGDEIKLKLLIRVYRKTPDFGEFFRITGDSISKELGAERIIKSRLLIPKEVTENEPTEESIEIQKKAFKAQRTTFYDTSTDKRPFLNQIDEYVPETIYRPEDNIPLIYDLESGEKAQAFSGSYEDFIDAFHKIMDYINDAEYHNYINTINPAAFIADDSHPKLSKEDVHIMMRKLYKSLYQMYVVQDLIDDPMVTDIKITGPDTIRARVNGKAYLSNIHFLDLVDYRRFINALMIRNGLSEKHYEQRFSDDSDEKYILRFELIQPYITSVDYPCLHIRKVAKEKLLGDDLVKLGMMPRKVWDYILDRARTGRGIIFSGPPGSGKTVALNALLEEGYEDSAEIMVLQESEELTSKRNGIIFVHTVNNPPYGKPEVTLEDLGKMALVAGCNAFIVGEVKGAEVCSLITLSNSGCRIACTVHSFSATETMDKLADLSMRGYSTNIVDAKRSMKAFQTIVQLENFQIKEVVEVVGFDEERKDLIYKYIYRKEPEEYESIYKGNHDDDAVAV